MAEKRPIIMISAGAPEWVVTFSDMMSLMLTFFILLFSVSEVKQDKIYDLSQAVAAHFDIDAITAGFLDEDLGLITEFMLELPSKAHDNSEGDGGTSAMSIENGLGEMVAVSKADDSLRMEIQGRVMFDEGSAEIEEIGRQLLGKLVEELTGGRTRIRVVGHASPLPLPASSAFEGHDELAFQRARVVASVLTAQHGAVPGIDPRRVELSSRGARDILPGVDLFDAKSRSSLDRVEIIVTPEDALKFSRN